MKFAAARAISATSTWVLKNIFHRPAANFPGKVALYVDKNLIAHLKPKLKKGSICVVGTNGKTTVSNLIANVLEQAGNSVICNREGANLDSGVATALLHGDKCDWGVLETDELWLAKILPQLKSKYVLLLNLFRDQLDRCGEIDRIQQSIVGALEKSPDTVLVYNADDPLCATIAALAAKSAARKKTPSIAFGTSESMLLRQNKVNDATMCQRCSSMLEYTWRQYGQLGEWYCPACGFERPKLNYEIQNIKLTSSDISFELANTSQKCTKPYALNAPFSSAYMAYNLGAVATIASILGVEEQCINKAFEVFKPNNGRLQTYNIAGKEILLNLAKNPTGFNQNLKIITQDKSPKVVAFFINDKQADGHDVSWLWDVDFEEVASLHTLQAFAGGIRALDMAVRLKYAGVSPKVVQSAQEFLACVNAQPEGTKAYIIANYTALPQCKAALDAAASNNKLPNEQVAETQVTAGKSNNSNLPVSKITNSPSSATSHTIESLNSSGVESIKTPIVIAHIFPDLLNLYGDGGNVRVLEQRLKWRGIPVEVKRVMYGDILDFSSVDLVMMGGSPDAEQKLASEGIQKMQKGLNCYIDSYGPMLAICGSFQMLGHEWLLDGQSVPGLGVIDMTTKRPGTSANRLVNNIALKSDIAKAPVVGYENHAGRTYLGDGVKAFGSVISNTGMGNNSETKQDGILYNHVIGTYLHGPLLAKNPEIADWLLTYALCRHDSRTGEMPPSLAPLDDALENAANEFMAHKLAAL